MKNFKKYTQKATAVLMVAFFAVYLSACNTASTPSSVPEPPALEGVSYHGSWVTPSGVFLVFNEDGSCGFFRTVNDLENDFYWGDETVVLRGEEALQDLGIDVTERGVWPYTDGENIYSIRLMYDTLYSEGTDKSDMMGNGVYEWLMFYPYIDMETGEERAIAVNVTTGSVFDYTRSDVTVAENPLTNR